MTQPNPTSIWDNPETKETVRRMWVDEQKSYNEIGAVLGVTRSQVSGYVRRAGLPKRMFKLFSARIKSPPRPSRPPVDKFTSKVAVEANKTAYDASPSLDASGSPYTTLTVREGQCRWIAVEPSAHVPMCGHGVKPGSKYCPEHHARTHVPMHIHTRQDQAA